MSTTIVNLPPQGRCNPSEELLPYRRVGLKSWLLTQDHKRIGILYLISITFFFLIGGRWPG